MKQFRRTRTCSPRFLLSIAVGCIASTAFRSICAHAGQPVDNPAENQDHPNDLCALGAPATLGFPPYVTFSGYLNGGYNETANYMNHLNVALLTWDTRTEFWLPPFNTDEFVWGPYLHLGGNVASRTIAGSPYVNGKQAVPALVTINDFTALPGFGFEVYPFSDKIVPDTIPLVTTILGPTRLYVEWNRTDYWGTPNTWRPVSQWKAGFDYWRTVNANCNSSWWWFDTWHGLWWQSSDEFDSRANTVNLADTLRAGVRIPNQGVLSWLTPYGVAVNTLDSKASYTWDNNFQLGAGFRIAPNIAKDSWLGKITNYFNLYFEYTHEFYYHGYSTPSSNHNITGGIEFSVGQYYK